MFELKPLSGSAIPAALEKAERYRLLNEPAEAESICRDVLKADPDEPAGVDHASAGRERSLRQGLWR